MSHKITTANARLFKVPLREILSDSTHGIMEFFQLVIVEIETNEGLKGCGHAYTVGFGGSSILEMLKSELLPWLIGKNPNRVEALWDEMLWKAHYVGRGGIVTYAVSAIDIALHDIRAKKAGMPLYELLGGASDRVKCYGSGIDLYFEMDHLIENTQGFIDSGMKAVKIKVGRENLNEDLERVEAVRSHIGKDILFMVDVNMRWTPDTVKRAEAALVKNDLYWLEEPLIPDDIGGFAKLGNFCRVPIAGGENFYSIYEFHNALRMGYLDFLQPDPGNIGGVTGMMKVASLASAYNVPICSHGIQELSVSILSALPNPGLLEIHCFYVEDYTKSPVKIEDGMGLAPKAIGHGIEFDYDKLDPLCVGS